MQQQYVAVCLLLRVNWQKKQLLQGMKLPLLLLLLLPVVNDAPNA
jgi:hypothetical protein